MGVERALKTNPVARVSSEIPLASPVPHFNFSWHFLIYQKNTDDLVGNVMMMMVLVWPGGSCGEFIGQII